MKIVVCSKNKAKNDAVEAVVKKYFDSYDIVSLETNSDVSETPIGDDEGIKGCLNRINDAMRQNKDGDLYLAMEGILTKSNYGTFLCGWSVIFDKKDNDYLYGCSAKVRVPDDVIKKTTKDIRLSDVVAEYVGMTGDVVSNLGTNGILTNGEYTRTDEFIDSVNCAMSSKFKKI